MMPRTRETTLPDPVRRALGRMLLDAGAISPEELEHALDLQRREGRRLGELLVRGGLDPERVARALAVQLGLAYAPPPLRPGADALRLVGRPLAVRLRALPLALADRALRVAMADPLDIAAVDDLQFQTGRRVQPVVATGAAVERGIVAAYGGDAVRALVSRLPGKAAPPGGTAPPAAPADEKGAELRRAAEAPPIIALVELILARAVTARASDIHIEPAAGRMRVRVRVDGVLREILDLPASAAAAVVSRLKVMAGLDISVKRRPQDGRAAIAVEGRDLALRMSTLPSRHGEKVVLRLLDPRNSGRPLDALDLEPADRRRLDALLGRGHGVLLVTGPTGSGKTTTLYAALAALDRARRNIITLEDPIEYQLEGITQVQVHRRAGLGFAAALRAVLRQDPDVIMVGEMRDRATVQVGLAAALTGHLVLSTLHTNDAPGAVTRLLEMKAPAYLVAGALIGVVAQRLVRRLCPHCRAPRDAAPAELAALGLPSRPARLFEPAGCPRCDGTGFAGRVGIFEVLVVDARVRELILRRAPADAVREAARAAGSQSLALDAWRKLGRGLTSLGEVAPFLALLADEAPLCPRCAAPVRAAYNACPRCAHTLRHRCRCGAALDPAWRCCPACAAPLPDAPAPAVRAADASGPAPSPPMPGSERLGAVGGAAPSPPPVASSAP